MKKADQLRAGEVQSGDHGGPPDSLKIENPTDQPRTVTVLDLDSPGVTTFHYALDGSVRYEGVEGKSYLEMWNWFADGGMYFWHAGRFGSDAMLGRLFRLAAVFIAVLQQCQGGSSHATGGQRGFCRPWNRVFWDR